MLFSADGRLMGSLEGWDDASTQDWVGYRVVRVWETASGQEVVRVAAGRGQRRGVVGVKEGMTHYA